MEKAVVIAEIPNKSKNFFGIFNAFSEESSIHSLSYIGKKNIHWLERLFWILAFVTSLGSCCYLVYRTFVKWERDPVLVSFNERLTPISQIPFPALTICSPSPYDAFYFNITSVMLQAKTNFTNLDSRDKDKLESLDKICDYDHNLNYTKTNLDHIGMLLSIANPFDYESTAQSTFCQDFCSFRGIFRKILTERGTCRTFNMLDEADLYTDKMKLELRLPSHELRSNWTVYGYDEKTDAFAYPVRNLGSGIQNGLDLRIQIERQDIDNGKTCFKSPSALYIALHSPDELPRIGSHFIKISYDVQTTIAVQPKVTSTSDSLKSYLPEQRQCYYDHEKKLKFFKAYSQAKCLQECFAEYILQECGCVAVYMVHEEETKICEKLECVKKSEMMWNFYLFEAGLMNVFNNKGRKDGKLSSAKVNDSAIVEMKKDEEGYLVITSSGASTYVDEFGHMQIGNYLLKNELFSEIKNTIYKDKFMGVVKEPPSCDCLQACSSINYDAVVSQLNFGSFERKTENDSSVIVPITIYLRDDFFIEIKRTELYNWINFLSNCGGFLGLLMGGSFLSLVEIIYHFGLKTFFKNIRTPNVEETKSSI